MASNKILEQKKVIVSELASKLKSAKSIVFCNYRGITVLKDTQMRNELRKNNIEYFVAKNTYTKLALKEAGITGLDEYLNGPTAIAISVDDETAPARVLAKYADEISTFECKAGYLDGQVLTAEGVAEVSRIPSKEVLYSKLAGGLNQIVAGLAIALKAVADKMADGAPAEAGAEAAAE